MIRTLSGFLGLPADWDFLPWPHLPYRRDEAGAEDVLLGYSMGGRLALAELLLHEFRGAVIVSAGLNLMDVEERRARRAADEVWAGRFEREPWPELMESWNDQPVFGGHRLARSESDYERPELARQLRTNSPGVLEPLEPRLGEITTPVLWVAGERDARYAATARSAAAQMPAGRVWICPDAGHRVPWEQPEAFVRRLRDFLELQ